MASHAQLGHARSIAKTDYEICKGEAEARARPPGGQNVNKRLLENGVKKVNEAWRNYYDAALTFVDRGTFAEAPEQVAARNLVTQESLAHEDWFEGVETILTQLELADNPPVEIGLNQAQVLLGIDADIEVMKETRKKDLDDVEALMNGTLAPVTRERMAGLQTMITEVLESVRGPVSELFDQRIEEDPYQVKATTRAKREFISICMPGEPQLQVIEDWVRLAVSQALHV